MTLKKTSSTLHDRYSKGWKTQRIRFPPPVIRLLIQFWIYWEQLKKILKKKSDGINKETYLFTLAAVCQVQFKCPFHFQTTFNLHSLVWDFNNFWTYTIMSFSIDGFNVLSLKHTFELQSQETQDFREPEWRTGCSCKISNFMVFQSLQKSVTCNSKHLRPSSALFWYIKGCFWYHEQYLNHFFHKPWEFCSITLVLS